MSLFYIIAGEASGDALGAGFMHSIKDQGNHSFAGIGGDAMRMEGLNSLFPYQELAVMGFLEIIPQIPKFLRLLNKTVQDIEAKQPDVIITIDSPGFNFRLAKMLKENPRTSHIKRAHYVAPSVWAYKPGRAQKTAKLFDLLLTLLPFEPRYFVKEGLNTVFVGHPVLWQGRQGDKLKFRARHGIKVAEPILLLLPGSRIIEVQRHLPIFLKAAETMTGYRPVILAAGAVKDFIQNNVPPHVVVCDVAEKQDAFAAADMALSKSGTITLELAAAYVPTVVAHKVNAFSAWLIRRMLLIKYASLVNIAAGKEILPELMQEHCNSEEIAQALVKLATPEAKQQQNVEAAEALALLHGDGQLNPNAAAAKAVLDLVRTS